MENITTNNREQLISKPTTGLVSLTQKIDALNLPFIVGSVSMIIMLAWAGAFKMTNAGSEGIAPLVLNSPFISWNYKLFGPHVGGDLIGATEHIAAVLYIIGFFKPKAGIVGALITILMFIVTSSMLITTPDSLISVGGMKYMNNLGLFLYKDLIGLGLSLYLLVQYGKKAALK